eukprot:PhM_4_TR17168/c0_g1_i1/m.79597
MLPSPRTASLVVTDDDDVTKIRRSENKNRASRASSSSLSTHSCSEELQRVLISYYVYYCPEHLSTIPELVTQYSSAGACVDVMLSRFGRQPTADEVHACLRDRRTACYVILARHNPSARKDLESKLDDHAADDVLRHLKRKYRVGDDLDPFQMLLMSNSVRRDDDEDVSDDNEGGGPEEFFLEARRAYVTSMSSSSASLSPTKTAASRAKMLGVGSSLYNDTNGGGGHVPYSYL